MTGSEILLVEDDLNFGFLLSEYLKMHGYLVTLVRNGIDGLNLIKNQRFALCILDVMMPQMDGFSLAREINSIQPEALFIFLTAKHLKEDITQGYRLGAIDYLTKPFDTEIMLLKIQALLKHGKQSLSPQEKISIGSFQFDPERRLLMHHETLFTLSPKCASLLLLLLSRKNQILARENALQSIWKESNYFTARSMDVYINKLRKYFSPDPDIKIINIHGQGYILEMP